jgi:tetratricopeptide (TPR) repeat protein
MRCSVDRLALGIAAGVLLAAFPTHLPAGPVNSGQIPMAKMEEIEKAGAALQRGQIDEAYKLLQEAIKKNPSLPPPRLMLARLFLVTNEGQQRGRALIEQSATEFPEDPRVYVTSAFVAMNDGRVTDGILNSEHALKLSSADRWTADQKREVQSQARSVLAAAFESRRDWAPARIHLTALLDLEKNGRLRQRLARTLFFLDKPEDAFQELQQAVKDDPTLDPPTVSMAQLWAEKADAKAARDWFEKAVKAEPNSVRVQLGYANWLLQQNEIEQAKIHSDMAAKLDGNSVDVRKLQGLISRITKDFSTAERQFRHVLMDAPADFFASNQLALVLADQSDQSQRSRGLQQATINAQANPRSAEAIATLGYVQFRTGNTDEALKSLQAAVSPGQMAADTAYYLALVLAELKKPDESVKLLDGALKTSGLFVYRKEAQSTLERLKKAESAKDDKTKK